MNSRLPFNLGYLFFIHSFQDYSAIIHFSRLRRIRCICRKEDKWFHISSVNYSNRRTTVKKLPLQFLKKQEYEYVEIWNNITIRELANVLNTDIRTLISLIPKDIYDKHINAETPLAASSLVSNLAKHFGKKCKLVAKEGIENSITSKKVEHYQPPSKPENLVKRPPVVTIMGHVDHGKTTLLDSLRNTFVVEQEFGGITQHIGAFTVEVKPGEKITFIDTPGHAAFTAMRARGAQVTDIVVLVIAADDGVMEQTVESITITTKAGVPMIIAVNKIDKPNALSIEQIKDKLLLEGIQVEDQGGNVQLVPISALKKINLDLLTEMILLEAELLNLRGDPTGLVEGVVIESNIDKMGIIATIIVQRGTLKKGKILVAGKAHARVRNMLDENKKQYNEVLPSTPVQISGWKELPVSGDKVYEVKSEKEANVMIKKKIKLEAEKKQEEDQVLINERMTLHQTLHRQQIIHFKSLTDFASRKAFRHEKYLKEVAAAKKEDTTPALNLILKGDVYGTLEVLSNVLNTYEQNEECKLSIVEASVGDITQSDVELALLFDAIIYAFNVSLNSNIQELVKEKQVDIRFFNVVYKLFDDLKTELNKKILPMDDEEIHGEAEILQMFSITHRKKKVPVAGSKCTKGQLQKNSLFRITRGDEIIYEGQLISMKHHKNEVNSVQKGVECGLMFESFAGTFLPGDKIICYDKIKVPRVTSWNPGF